MLENHFLFLKLVTSFHGASHVLSSPPLILLAAASLSSPPKLDRSKLNPQHFVVTPLVPVYFVTKYLGSLGAACGNGILGRCWKKWEKIGNISGQKFCS